MRWRRPRLQKPKDVAQRALVVQVICGRGALEDGAKEEGIDTQNSMVFWLGANGLLDVLTDREAQILMAPIGDLPVQTRLDCSWLLEPLGVLLWAMAKSKLLSPFDTPYTYDTVARLPIDNEFEVQAFVRRATLRTEPVLRETRTVCELWGWRVRAEQLRREGVEPWVRDDALKAFAATVGFAIHQELVEGEGDGTDLIALGRPVSRLSDDELSNVNSIAMERLRAMNWLCGIERNWDIMPQPDLETIFA